MKLIKCAKVPFKCMNGFYYYLDTDIPEKEFIKQSEKDWRDDHIAVLRSEMKLLQEKKNNLNLQIYEIENILLNYIIKLYEKKFNEVI